MKLSVIAVALSTAMAGCGGSSSSTPSPNDVAAADVAAANAAGTVSEGTFFNANDGINFASAVGGNLANVSSRALGSTSSVFGEASQNDDPASGIYNDDTSVEQCDSGSVSSSIGTSEAGELDNASLVFNNCVIDGQTTTGSMSFTSQSSGSSDTLTVSFDDFAVSGSEGNSSMDGAVRITIDDDLSSRVSGTRMTMTVDGDRTEFSNFDLESQVNLDTEASSLGGQATITSTQDGRITMSINPAYASDGEEYPTRGAMTLIHEDGSSLIIDAATGDSATYAYTINGGGSITSGIGNWEDEIFDLTAFAE